VEEEDMRTSRVFEDKVREAEVGLVGLESCWAWFEDGVTRWAEMVMRVVGKEVGGVEDAVKEVEELEREMRGRGNGRAARRRVTGRRERIVD
jgi:hypothetical protein